MSEYQKIDLDGINFSNETVSYEDATNGVAPLIVSDIVSDTNQIIITKAEKDYDNRCVKLEISY